MRKVWQVGHVMKMRMRMKETWGTVVVHKQSHQSLYPSLCEGDVIQRLPLCRIGPQTCYHLNLNPKIGCLTCQKEGVKMNGCQWGRIWALVGLWKKSFQCKVHISEDLWIEGLDASAGEG